MKAETFYLKTPQNLAEIIIKLNGVNLDGKTKVTVSGAETKRQKQRGLQWKWYTEVAKSGVGGRHESHKDGVHLVSKYRWAVPIMLADPEQGKAFGALWDMVVEKHGDNEEFMLYFVDKHVSTEIFTVAQTAEYLTSFAEFYVQHGVQLTQPDDGLMDYANAMERGELQ